MLTKKTQVVSLTQGVETHNPGRSKYPVHHHQLPAPCLCLSKMRTMPDVGTQPASSGWKHTLFKRQCATVKGSLNNLAAL